MRILTIVLALLAAGCSRVPMLPSMSSYKIDIQQGNYVTQDMVSKLKPGMTRSQVRYILGTPLVADPFHADRWDYVYHMQKGGTTTEFRRIMLMFEQDKLARIEGDVVPAPAAGQTGGASGKLGADDKKAGAGTPPAAGVASQQQEQQR
ncbi:MAG TPA: outer membrane protein assembly factor BamE [Burkholderiales bacterium]